MACTPSPGPGDRRYGPGRRIAASWNWRNDCCAPADTQGHALSRVAPVGADVRDEGDEIRGSDGRPSVGGPAAAAQGGPPGAGVRNVPRTEAVRPAAGLGPNCARCGCRGRSSRGRGPPSAGSSAGSGSTSARAGGRIESIRGRIDVAVITIRGENPRKHWPDHVNARSLIRRGPSDRRIGAVGSVAELSLTDPLGTLGAIEVGRNRATRRVGCPAPVG